MKVAYITLAALMVIVLSGCSSTTGSSVCPSVKASVIPIDLNGENAIKIYRDPETGKSYRFLLDPNTYGVIVIEQFETTIQSKDAKIIVANTRNVLTPQEPAIDVVYQEICFLRHGKNDLYYSVVRDPSSHDPHTLCLNLGPANVAK